MTFECASNIFSKQSIIIIYELFLINVCKADKCGGLCNMAHGWTSREKEGF
jgi:hypothetical protein